MIYNSQGLLIGVVDNAVANLDPFEIKHRTLGGDYILQQLGTPGTILEVVAHFTYSQKALFDLAKRINEPLSVIFDGRIYTGVVDSGLLEYERRKSVYEPMFRLEFSLLVTGEEAES